MKLYLHIGAHKTGTTALQNAFDDRSDAVAAADLCYPRVCWYHHSQHRLAFAMKRLRDPARGDVPDLGLELADLRAVLAESRLPTAFVSSEEFFSAPAEAVAQLFAGLDGFDVEVIACLRRPDDLFISSYAQKTKQIGNDFKHHYRRFLDNPAAMEPDLDFDAAIRTWAEHVGTARLHLLTYENIDIVEAVCAILGLDPQLLANERGRINVNPSAKAIELIRLAKHHTDDPAVLKVVSAFAVRRFPRPAVEASMEDGHRRRIVGHFEAGNAEVFARFGRPDNPYSVANLFAAPLPPFQALTTLDLTRALIELLGRQG